MYAFAQSMNIISTDQKLMCPIQFQSLLVYSTISNSAFKSNYNKAFLFFYVHGTVHLSI